jgi:hypothetical protein
MCIAGGAAVGIGGTIILLVSAANDPSPEELLRNPRSASIVPLEDGAILSFEGTW